MRSRLLPSPTCGRGGGWAAALPAVVVMTALVAPVSPAGAVSTDHRMPTDGALWRLDEPSGSKVASDSVGLPNDGRIRGRVVPGEPGVHNTGYLFDGGWIEVDRSQWLNPGSRDFAVSAHVQLRRLPRRGETFDIIRKGTAGAFGGEFKLEIGTAGKVRCVAQGIKPSGTTTVARAITPKVNLADGRWHHVKCGRTGATWTARVDRVTRSVHVDVGSIGNSKPVAMGAKYGWEDYTRGGIDRVRLSFFGAS